MQRLGIWSASALFVMGLAYIIVVAAAMISGGGYTNPIGDPLLSVMEALTLLGVALMVVLMAAVYGYAPTRPEAQPLHLGTLTASPGEPLALGPPMIDGRMSRAA